MDIKISYFVLLSFFMLSCGTNKETTPEPTVPVVVNITKRIPHCGGAAPVSEDEWPKLEYFSGHSMSVHVANEDGSRGKQVATFTTNDLGRADLNLPNGKYQLWSLDKLETFDRFLEVGMEPVRENYESKDEDCYREWYNKVDFELEVGEKTNFSFLYKSTCYVGIHPCLIYTGPFRP